MYFGPKREQIPATLSRSDASSSVGTSGRSAMVRHPTPMQPVFDGHNDALLRATAEEIVAGRGDGPPDVPRASAGGLAAGVFAGFTPRDEGEPVITHDGWGDPPPPPPPARVPAAHAPPRAGPPVP